MPKQKELKELNTSIKDFVSVMDKQIGKLKNADPKPALKETPNKDNKGNTTKEANDSHKPALKETPNKDNKGNMTKEANDSHKPKTQKNPKNPKQQINDTTQCDNTPKSTTCKRNATEISPLRRKARKKNKRRN